MFSYKHREGIPWQFCQRTGNPAGAQAHPATAPPPPSSNSLLPSLRRSRWQHCSAWLAMPHLPLPCSSNLCNKLLALQVGFGAPATSPAQKESQGGHQPERQEARLLGVQRGLSGLQGGILAIISGRITALPTTLPPRPPGCSWSSDLEFACGHGEKDVRQEEVQKGPREPTRQSLFHGRGETWRFGEFEKMFWRVDTPGRE